MRICSLVIAVLLTATSALAHHSNSAFDGDKVVVKWTFTGTHSGPLTVSRRVKVPDCIAIYRIANGKIAEGTMTWNKHDLLRQLGVVS